MNAASNSRPRPVLGVLLGLLIDIGGTVITFGAVSIVYMYVLARNGTRHRDLIEAFTSTNPESAFFLLCMAMLASCCFFGGLVCQRLARSPHDGLTALTALLCIAIGLAATSRLYSWVEWLIMAAVTACSLFLGAKVAGRRG